MRVYDKYSLYFEILIIQGVANWDKGLDVVYFLKSCFLSFPRECNLSTRNHHFGLEKRGYFQRQFSP